MSEIGCPVCSLPLEGEKVTGGHYEEVSCPACGTFQISRTALASLPESFVGDINLSRALSHYIWRKRKGTRIPMLNSDDVRHVKENPWLPGVEEQLQNLLLLLGDESEGAAANISLDTKAEVKVGTLTSGDLWKLKEWAEERLYVEDAGSSVGGLWARLTLSGWQLYDEIKRGALHTNDAFMALGFGNSELDDVVTKCFKPAVKDTGFHLVRMDDRPEAGIMDNRMQLMIKRSRFLIADITNSNLGAYWEAGYAFGLGKPVIYSCRRSEWEDREAHFDVNHHLSIIWDTDNLDQTAKDLKAAIRNTIPEAKQED